MIADWDDAYANTIHIPGGADYPARWDAAAAAFRAAHPPTILTYGPHPRERIDLFRPEGEAKGLLVFVHGGYWHLFDQSSWSHFAAGAVERGWAVAMPGYVLAPEARVSAITTAIARAITVAADEVEGPIVLTGHSAGGHLVTRQVCDDSRLPQPVRARIARVVSISGLHDLRPLLRTSMNSELRLDAAEAAAESPALRIPLVGAKVHAWTGANERPEFVRQAALLANVWHGLGAETAVTLEPGRHHFDVLDGLARADSPLLTALLGD